MLKQNISNIVFVYCNTPIVRNQLGCSKRQYECSYLEIMSLQTVRFNFRCLRHSDPDQYKLAIIPSVVTQVFIGVRSFIIFIV